MTKFTGTTSILPENDFLEAVRIMPLISFDLLVQDSRGRVLLGLRKNNPAKGYWFVPGGIIRKNESLTDAFSRISLNELGQEIAIKKCRIKGIYEHFYDENFTGKADINTHYVVLAYVLPWQYDDEDFPEDQHESYKWFSIEKLVNDPYVHPNTKAYWANEPA